MNRFIAVGILVLICITGQTQEYQKDYFQQPVDGKLLLSGNFGELRSDHFHSGLDFKTGGKIGAKIYASADGYIARIKISLSGFGKAIYIKHPNGYTTVYGHLNHFSKDIESYVRKKQYERESFTIELFPKASELKVKKGEVIAFSGNTGGSAGPHLHYEIRDSKTEKPINPVFFGFKIKDYIKPKIKAVKIYASSENSKINDKNEDVVYKTSGWGLKYRLKNDPSIKVKGPISLGISTYDLTNDSYNKVGVYQISLKVDSQLVYRHKIERFAFSESKYINSFIDYAHYIAERERFQRIEKDPGNKLSLYGRVENSGILEFNDTLVHHVVYEVMDVHNNISRLQFNVQSELSDSISGEEKKKKNWFDYRNANKYSDSTIKLNFKKRSFYRSFEFKVSEKKHKLPAYSNEFAIHTDQTPVHRPFTIQIPLKSIKTEMKEKLFIARIDDGEYSLQNSKFIGDTISATLRKFGNYVVIADTTSPTIKALNIHNGKNIEGYKRLVFEIDDDLSGVDEFRATINDKWILCEYEPKIKRLVYTIDDRMQKGENRVVLKIQDACKNEKTFEAVVNY